MKTAEQIVAEIKRLIVRYETKDFGHTSKILTVLHKWTICDELGIYRRIAEVKREDEAADE